MKLAGILMFLGVLAFSGTVAMGQATSRPSGLRGTVVKVDGTKLVVKTMARGESESKEVTVVTDDKTTVTLDGKDAKLADLKAGMMVNVTPTEGTATKIVATTPALRGQIVKIDGTKLVVKTMARGNAESKEVTVVTDDKTVITLDGKDAKLADLKADLYVSVTPVEGTATKIVATTTAPVRGGGRGGNN